MPFWTSVIYSYSIVSVLSASLLLLVVCWNKMIDWLIVLEYRTKQYISLRSIMYCTGRWRGRRWIWWFWQWQCIPLLNSSIDSGRHRHHYYLSTAAHSAAETKKCYKLVFFHILQFYPFFSISSLSVVTQFIGDGRNEIREDIDGNTVTGTSGNFMWQY